MPEFVLPSFAIGTGGLAGNPQNSALNTDLEVQISVIRESLQQFKAHHMRVWIDSALHYGAGNALKAIGMALGKEPGKDTVLSIKVGRILEAPTPDTPYEPSSFCGEAHFNRRFDYSESGVLRAFRQSFEFLNAGRVQQGWQPVEPGDLDMVVFVHDPETGVHGDKTDFIIQQVRHEALPALRELRRTGKIKAVGVGTNEITCALKLAGHADLDLLMIAGRLTLLSNSALRAPAQIQQDTAGLTELLQEAKKHRKSIISAAPGQSGMLYEGGTWYNYQPAPNEIITFRESIRAVFDKYHVPLTAGALQFPLLAGAKAIVCGICSNQELANNLAYFSHNIPQALWCDLEAQDLIGRIILKNGSPVNAA